MGKIKVLWHRLKEQQKSGFDYVLELTIFLYPVVSLILHTKIDPSVIRAIVFGPSLENVVGFFHLFQLSDQVYTDLTISIILMFTRLGILLLAYSKPALSKLFGGLIIALALMTLFSTTFQIILVERFMAEQLNYRFILYALIIHISTDVVKAFVLRDPV